MKPPTHAQRKSHARDNAGCIVTSREQQTGEWRTEHYSGLLQDALRDACARMDARTGDWKIVTISTPRTVAADLTRNTMPDPMGRERLLPEQLLLGRIGRLDMLQRAAHTSIYEDVSRGRTTRVAKPAA